MDADAIRESKREADAGLDALGRGRRADAGQHFMMALNHLDDIQDDRQRRGELGPIALLFDRVGFPDLALMAGQEAVELARKLRDRRHLAEDIVTCGNAHLHLGNTGEAEKAYRQALDICLDNGDYDNAASASTNLAVIVGNNGDMDEAIRLLKSSLEYLKKQAHDSTEITTRIALVQALEVVEREPELVIETARTLFERFSGQLRQDQWDNTAGPLKSAIERYLKSRPRLDGRAWKAQNFPQLYR